MTTGRVKVVIVCVFSLLPAMWLHAQREQQDPLTEAQQNQIADAGIDANLRIKLYTKFLNQRAENLEAVAGRSESGRGQRLDDEMQLFISLTDELSSNLDEYGGRKADIRKAMKDLNEAIPRWQKIVRGLPRDSAYNISLDEARDTLNDLADQSKQLTTELTEYFKKHKDAKGEQWAEPK